MELELGETSKCNVAHSNSLYGGSSKPIIIFRFSHILPIRVNTIINRFVFVTLGIYFHVGRGSVKYFMKILSIFTKLCLMFLLILLDW